MSKLAQSHAEGNLDAVLAVLPEVEIDVPRGTAEVDHRGAFVTEKFGESLSVFERLDQELGERRNGEATAARSPGRSPQELGP